eukprot:TRINITY_DN52_c0_g1_i2.p1 TRINITY_DN52_c0_g1~~TRINITY_DN52_c0_g1_i2.p1  ORF type:complete len:462 (+),score=37.43 TRINITY_DN52_c0_g1_i2:73-1386(+)
MASKAKLCGTCNLAGILMLVVSRASSQLAQTDACIEDEGVFATQAPSFVQKHSRFERTWTSIVFTKVNDPHNGKCIGYDHWGDLYLYPCANSDSQKWTVVDGQIQNKHRAGCLTADRMWPKIRQCSKSGNQQWIISASGQIKNGGRCLQQLGPGHHRLGVVPCDGTVWQIDLDVTPTPRPTPTPTPRPTPRPTSRPTPTPTPQPTLQPTPRPTPTPTQRPTTLSTTTTLLPATTTKRRRLGEKKSFVRLGGDGETCEVSGFRSIEDQSECKGAFDALAHASKSLEVIQEQNNKYNPKGCYSTCFDEHSGYYCRKFNAHSQGQGWKPTDNTVMLCHNSLGSSSTDKFVRIAGGITCSSQQLADIETLEHCKEAFAEEKHKQKLAERVALVRTSREPKGCYSDCFDAWDGYTCRKFNEHSEGNSQGTDGSRYLLCVDEH